MCIHRPGRLSAITHGEDHRRTTPYDIATGKDHIFGGLHGLIVDDDGSPGGHFHPGECLWYQRVGGDTHTYDHLIHPEPDSLSFYGYGTATTRLIRLTQLHPLKLHPLYPSTFIAFITKRVMQRVEINPLFFGMFDLLHPGRHLLLRAAVDNHRLLGPQAACGTYRIHGGVATANNGYLLPLIDRGVTLRIGCLHKVYTCEVLVA